MLGGTARRIVLVFQKDSWLSKKVDFYYLSRVEDALESQGTWYRRFTHLHVIMGHSEHW